MFKLKNIHCALENNAEHFLSICFKQQHQQQIVFNLTFTSLTSSTADIYRYLFFPLLNIFQVSVAKHKLKYRNYDMKSSELAYNRLKLQKLSLKQLAMTWGTSNRVAGHVSLDTYASGPESLLLRSLIWLIM